MKIESRDGVSPGSPSGTEAVRRKKVGKAEGSPRPTPAPGDDEASLSEEAQARQAAAQALQRLPEVRTAKVEELKAAIKAGTYKVPGEQIAEKLLDETP